MINTSILSQYLCFFSFKLSNLRSYVDNFAKKVIQAHLPLTLVCLDGLGNLADKHPIMAPTAIQCLRDFLVNPSDILSHLHNSSVKLGAQKPGIFVSVTNSEQVRVNQTT